MLPVTDTRFLFRPLTADITAALRSLPPDSWELPTTAGDWRVRDVAAHLIDTALRRLSFHRDGRVPPAPAQPLADERDFVRFINDLNASWVRAANRLSIRVLTDLYARAGGELADFFEAFSLDAPALFPVSWAGDVNSAGWVDAGREFTEVWHHGAQIRQAVGAGPYPDPRWLQAVLEIAIRAVPHAYRDVAGREGQTLAIEITGAAGGTWTMRREGDRWTMDRLDSADAAARAVMTDETAWRLLFNALPADLAEPAVRLEGMIELARPLLRARAVIV